MNLYWKIPIRTLLFMYNYIYNYLVKTYALLCSVIAAINHWFLFLQICIRGLAISGVTFPIMIILIFVEVMV